MSRASRTTLLLSVLLTACGGGGGGSAVPPEPVVCEQPCAVTLSWAANPEQTVDQAGGGYRVYLATSPGTPLAGATLITVPFDPLAGSTPTTTALQLTAGTWYVRVAAFSALNPAGSSPSTELAMVVP